MNGVRVTGRESGVHVPVVALLYLVSVDGYRRGLVKRSHKLAAGLFYDALVVVVHGR